MTTAHDTLVHQAIDSAFDVLWLEHCPLLQRLRTQPAFIEALRLTRERAAAIRAP
jgi:hypothetical protein